MATVFDTYFRNAKKQLAILIDPDRHTKEALISLIRMVDDSKVDLVLVGSSLSGKNYEEVVSDIKANTSKPTVLFPGNALQLSSKADAILNLSLISGRNPEFLIGEHVKSAFYIKNSGLEVIPTAYILVAGGKQTSVEYISNTNPIPRDKTDIAVATALAGKFLGLQVVYLEAGSGATLSVPNDMIRSVKENTHLPIICGGGIRSAKEVQEKWDAGADIVVVGTAFEQNANWLKDL